MPQESDLDQVLAALAAGEDGAAEALLPLVYDRLRALASSHMQQRPNGVTLQPTAVVNEAYLRMQRRDPGSWEGKGHFLAVAAQAIRQVLIDASRRRTAAKRGGGARNITFVDGSALGDGEPSYDILDLDEALRALAGVNERHARVVELRFFGGMSVEQTAALLGVSKATVKADWALARSWLQRRLADGREGAGS